MTIVEYNEIIRKVNSDSLERSIFIEIDRYCKAKGMEIFQLEYDEYFQMRNYLFNINKNGLMNKFESVDSIPEKKKKERCTGQIFTTLVIIAVLVVLANVSEIFTFFAYSGAVITAIVGFGTLPIVQNSRFISQNYNSDYVERYLRAHEDARMNMDAYLTQAYLRSGQIKIVNQKINDRK